ncbi:MAG TPA: 50S ribosomal protein L25/general stress protein Ctc [Glaciibacter sp.]|nr:50S ribosomal protein L25/general stress protein Ctc [Glaciibacter sp.]
MADENKVVADLREKFGKGAARKLRVLGKIPAVIYGHGTDPVHVSLPAHTMALLLRKANAVVELDLDGTTHLTLVKDVQKDPVLQIIEHIDLIVIRAGERVEVEVPVHLVGEPYPGTIAMLELNTIRLMSEATHIPENVVIDVEGAEEGTQIHAKDIKLPAGSTLADDADALVLNVMVPSATREDAEAEEAAAATAAAAE